MSAAKEIQWVQSSQAGNREAFAQLVDRYRGTVTGVAYSVLGDFARSEDAGQEAFWKHGKRFHHLPTLPSLRRGYAPLFGAELLT